MKRRWSTHFFLVFIMLVLACKNSENEKVVASVGKEKFYLQQLSEHFAKTAKIPKGQYENIIQKWIESELIYQEALRRGIDKNVDLQKQIEKLARESIISYFIENYIEKSITVSDTEINQYYDENSKEFIRIEDEYHLLLLLLNSHLEASEISKRISKGEEWSKIAQSASLDGSRNSGGDLGYIKIKNLLPDIAKAVLELSAGEISRPIKTELGYQVIKLVEIKKKGETLSLNEVKELIEIRVKAKRRDEKFRKILSGLSEKTEIKNNFDLIPSN